MRDRWNRPDIGDDRLRVLVRQAAIERDRHRRPNDGAVRPLALADRHDDLLVRPFADAGLRIGRDVRRVGDPKTFLELGSARQLAARCRSLRRLRRVTVAARHDAVHQVLATLERRLGRCCYSWGDERHRQRRSESNHRSSIAARCAACALNRLLHHDTVERLRGQWRKADRRDKKGRPKPPTMTFTVAMQDGSRCDREPITTLAAVRSDSASHWCAGCGSATNRRPGCAR